VGGAAGYFGYDFAHYYERLPRKAVDDLQVPDCYLVLSRAAVVFDHVQGVIKIIVLDEMGEGRFSETGKILLAHLEARILAALRRPVFFRRHENETFHAGRIESNLKKPEFLARVRVAKQYIEAGDIFQVVISQRLKVPFQGSPFFLYRTLRRVNPSPYLFYFSLPEMQIIGSSPEMLLKRQGTLLITRPLAGTRPRGKNEAEDFQFEEELRNCQKERAEHVMLVDLGRNDLGRVSRYGSVAVTELLEIERYSHVMHLVSEVRGNLAPDQTVYDALKAVFPAGTVSGAPKIRAMEIIEELEPQRRGIYAGAVGYLSLTGHLDTCIAIRTILIKDGYFFAQAGAGIVADSDPEREYEETCNKAAALLKSLSPEVRR
jgi:anthranilate synthase component 1